MTFLRRLVRTLSVYATATTWIVAAGLLAGVAGRAISFGTSLAVLSLVAISLLMLATHQEVTQIHVLVNSQRDEMVAKIDRMSVRHEEMSDTISRMSNRIGELLDALTKAHVPIPATKGEPDDRR